MRRLAFLLPFLLAFFVAGFFLTSILAHQAWKEWRPVKNCAASSMPRARCRSGWCRQPRTSPALRSKARIGQPIMWAAISFSSAPATTEHIRTIAISPAARLSSLAMSAERAYARRLPSPRSWVLCAPCQTSSLLEFLAALNRGLTGKLGGGFVTCCAITISADVVAKIANAGHLPPYRNGKEMTLDGGLPLGILPGAEFTETSVRMDPTDCLTLITDGVLEARNPASGELFGFDRTAAISEESAERVAQAAQEFGQEDDITMLTLNLAQSELLRA